MPWEEDVVNKLQYIKAFGLRIFAIKSIRRMVLKSNSSLAWKINDINERTIGNYLIETTEKSRKSGLAIDLNPIKTDVPNEPIWVLWYQGIDKAPDIVKCCVESVKEHSNGHQVIVLSEDNLHEYIELPDFIMEKFKKGYITRTHLSDLIRLNLLYLYGGAWLDATVLALKDIPEEYFKSDLFSLNFGKKTKDPSHGRWTTFCYFAKKGNELMYETLRYHYYYWAQKNSLVDYIMFDYFINLTLKNNQTCARQIADIKPSNKAVFDLVEYLNLPYKDNAGRLTDDGNVFSKLSWKRQYVTEAGGYQTIYGYLREKYFKE